MGYSVIHSTTHGPAEEGKDIIAKDNKGRILAFQLKRGNINVSGWRKMKSEIEELVELPIRHSSVKPNTKHKPVLVTNGYINEHVTSRIDGFNKSLKSRKFPELETWTGTELQMKFIQNTGSFIPEPIPEFHRLLGMLVKGGKGQLDKDEFDLILKSILPIGEKELSNSKREIVSKVKASAVIVEFALGSFDKAGNDFAKIEAYILFACYILALANRYKIQREVFEPTLRIIEDTIDSSAKNIWDATKNSKTFIDPMIEPIVGPYRNAITYGVLAAHGLWCLLGGKSSWLDEARKEIIKEMTKKTNRILISSEAFVPAIFLISEFLRQNGQVRKGDDIFKKLLQESILRKVKGATIRPL